MRISHALYPAVAALSLLVMRDAYADVPGRSGPAPKAVDLFDYYAPGVVPGPKASVHEAAASTRLSVQPAPVQSVFAQSAPVQSAPVQATPAQSAPIQLAMANGIPADQLGDIRGGFSLPSGMEISFGFDIATRVGGDVVQQLSVPMTNVPGTGSSVPLSVLSQGALSSVQLSLGSAAPVSVSSLANTGLTSITTTLGAGGISSLIQNQANGQVIQQTRVLDVSISGLTQSLAQQAAHTMMVNALAAASMPRH